MLVSLVRWKDPSPGTVQQPKILLGVIQRYGRFIMLQEMPIPCTYTWSILMFWIAIDCGVTLSTKDDPC